jgi:hypothetical protein
MIAFLGHLSKQWLCGIILVNVLKAQAVYTLHYRQETNETQ